MTTLAGMLIIAPAAHAATVSADFRASETPKLKVGFLHNLSASAPSDELLTPLKPTAWRSTRTPVRWTIPRSDGVRELLAIPCGPQQRLLELLSQIEVDPAATLGGEVLRRWITRA
jgi:hypothetical protein